MSGTREAKDRRRAQVRPPSAARRPAPLQTVERVQTGLRIEKRILKVLKAVAEYHGISLGDLIEGIVLHAFEGRVAFGPDSLRAIADLKRIYDLDLDARNSHRLADRNPGRKGA